MSAVPEDFMRDPAKDRDRVEEKAAQTGAEPETRAGIWQWLFIGVLLACWLAEATLCAATVTDGMKSPGAQSGTELTPSFTTFARCAAASTCATRSYGAILSGITCRSGGFV